jgi:hypothetical protein
MASKTAFSLVNQQGPFASRLTNEVQLACSRPQRERALPEQATQLPAGS